MARRSPVSTPTNTTQHWFKACTLPLRSIIFQGALCAYELISKLPMQGRNTFLVMLCSRFWRGGEQPSCKCHPTSSRVYHSPPHSLLSGSKVFNLCLLRIVWGWEFGVAQISVPRMKRGKMESFASKTEALEDCKSYYMCAGNRVTLDDLAELVV